MLVIVRIRTEAQDLTSHVGETGIKVVKSGGVDGGDGKCRERESGLLVSAIRSLEILSVKKESKL